MTLKQLIKSRSKELRSKSHVAFLNSRKVIDAKYAIAFQEESMKLVYKLITKQ